MVRSKRKWKKDSPEKLTKRIENELNNPKPNSHEEKSPENKKSKGHDVIPTDFSSGNASTPLLISNDSQPLSQTPTVTEDQTNNDIVDVTKEVAIDKNSEKMEEKKPPIEDTLNIITQSLSTLTETIATMSVNMVKKADIAALQNEMSSQGKQISENTEQIKCKLSLESGNQMAKKIKDHDVIMQNAANKIDACERNISIVEKTLKKQSERDVNTSNRIDGLAEALKKKNEETQREMEDIRKRLSEQNSEIMSLKNSQRVVTAPLPNNLELPNMENQTNFHTRSPKLNVVIEGLSESEDENLNEKIMLLCAKMGEEIDQRDILSAWRLKRRVPIGKNPNPVKICFANYHTKERIMSSKFKLKKQPGTENIWINHDETTVVRRAKGRARFIASYSRKKGSQVQITPSGIILDSVFYSYENLDRIPSIYIPPTSLRVPLAPPPTTTKNVIEPMVQSIPTPVNHADVPIQPIGNPQRVPAIEPFQVTNSTSPGNNSKRNSPRIPRTKLVQKMKLTASGLVYSGPTAIFSHLYKASFTIDNTPYNSVEQKIQYEKAMMAEDIQSAELIMQTQDTWTIKKIGDRVKVTKEYIDNRLHIARIGNEAKYCDNPDLMEALIETGDLNLIEGTKSSFWGGGEPYESQAYDDEDVHGKNHQGYMLVDLRTNERKRRAGIIP